MQQLRWQCSTWGIQLDDSRLSQLSAYADLLARYDLANVIGTKDREKIILEHLLDSLSCLIPQCLAWDRSLVDVGAGGGLPGIPLAIVCPELQVTLLEATEKKVSFLKHAREQLDLSNLEIIRARVEDTGRDPRYRETFDIATARALAALSVVVEYCTPLVRRGGHILAMKGRLQDDELSAGLVAAHHLRAQLREVIEVHYCSPLPQKERRLVLFDKVGPTPSKFPRRVGLAKKQPLGLG